MAMHGSDGSLSREAWILCERLHVRSTFATDVAIEELIRVIEGRRAWHRELAIELLGRRAREAGAALPALQRVLEQPEPRLLLVERTVPLHAKAARAVLAIAPGSGAAVLARDVLAGTRPAPAASALPARTQGRIAELVLELEEPATRDAAVANLGALGAAAAEPVAAALATSSDADVQRAALAVLRDLGPGAAAGTQHLLEATRTVPVDMLLDTLRVLVVAAAGTADVLSSLETIHMRGRVVVLGRRLDGVDEAFGERLSTIESEHFAAQLVDANGTMREIEEWLALPDPYIRERALAAVAKRGNAARPLLGKLGEMLRATHPSGVNSNGAGNVDRTSSVQRAAASAILAVAPAGDPLLDQARALLVEPERTK
jgi:hypothetical protein